MMFQSIRKFFYRFPRQYWLMIIGIVISTAGVSMIWPFLLIYVSGKLDLPLSTIAMLVSINAGTGLAASFIAGTLADRIGRKVVMNISLTVNGLAFFFLMNAGTYGQFIILMIMIGISNPLYQVGADAMLADMIPAEHRTDAYAINRIAVNAAFAAGAATGGFLAAVSYDLAFYAATLGFLSYSLLLFLLARETLTKQEPANTTRGQIQYQTPDNAPDSQPMTISGIQDGNRNNPVNRNVIGYARVFRDRGYILFVSLMSLGLIAPTMLWILMPIYTKTNFGVLENLYGWIPTTNALMCVFVQYPVTQLTRRCQALPVTAVGMLFYALGVGSVAWMVGFWGFWLSMVTLTIGELTLVPTASKYVADRAPANLRGRYMSIYWLGWGLARAASPLIGGYLNDNISPRSIWIGGLLIGLASSLGLMIFSIQNQSTLQPGSSVRTG